MNEIISISKTRYKKDKTDKKDKKDKKDIKIIFEPKYIDIIEWLFKHGTGDMQKFIEITVQNLLNHTMSCTIIYDIVKLICNNTKNIRYIELLLLCTASRSNDSVIKIIKYLLDRYKFDNIFISMCLIQIENGIFRIINSKKKKTISRLMDNIILIDKIYPDVIHNFLKNSSLTRTIISDYKSIKNIQILSNYILLLQEKQLFNTSQIYSDNLILNKKTSDCMFCMNPTQYTLKSCEHYMCDHCFLFDVWFPGKKNDICYSCKYIAFSKTKQYYSDDDDEDDEDDEDWNLEDWILEDDDWDDEDLYVGNEIGKKAEKKAVKDKDAEKKAIKMDKKKP
jgi:hypothetical protein